jgi:hypothetical protein
MSNEKEAIKGKSLRDGIPKRYYPKTRGARNAEEFADMIFRGYIIDNTLFSTNIGVIKL